MMNHYPVLRKESAKLCELDYLRITGSNERNLAEITGFACAKEILNYYGPLEDDHIAIYAGPGKNGGDGVSTAFFLAPHVKKISICIPFEPSDDVLNLNINRVKTFYPNVEFSDIPIAGDIYIDALFGAGFSKKPEETFKKFINAMNQQQNPVISIDIPSGSDANTSLNLGDVVTPDLTLAIGCLKPIHQDTRAEIICGKIVLVDIGLPHQLIDKYAAIQKRAC